MITTNMGTTDTLCQDLNLPTSTQGKQGSSLLPQFLDMGDLFYDLSSPFFFLGLFSPVAVLSLLSTPSMTRTAACMPLVVIFTSSKMPVIPILPLLFPTFPVPLAFLATVEFLLFSEVVTISCPSPYPSTYPHLLHALFHIPCHNLLSWERVQTKIYGSQSQASLKNSQPYNSV